MALGSSSARLSVNCAGEMSFFEHKAPTDFSHLNLFVRRIGNIPVSFRCLQVLRVSRLNFTHCLLAHSNSVVRPTTSPHTTEMKAGSEATTGILFSHYASQCRCWCFSYLPVIIIIFFGQFSAELVYAASAMPHEVVQEEAPIIDERLRATSVRSRLSAIRKHLSLCVKEIDVVKFIFDQAICDQYWRWIQSLAALNMSKYLMTHWVLKAM